MPVKKSPLGRGLDALLENYETGTSSRYESTAEPVSAGSICKLRLEFIDPNPFQPRTEIDDLSLQELAQSIREVGLIQPVTVRITGNNRYQIIAGERRFLASKIAGLDEIPVYIRTADDRNMLELALIENIQRVDLDPIEISISYRRLIEECHLTHEELSQHIGKDRSTVTNFLRLLKLPAVIQLALKQKKISMAHARTLSGLDDTEKQLEFFRRIITEGLSVRACENFLKNFATGNAPKNNAVKNDPPFSFEKIRLELSTKLQTPVSIRSGNNQKGQIVIPFDSEDHLLKIYGYLS